MCNLLEFLLGGNPTQPDSKTKLPSARLMPGGAALAFEFNRYKNAAGLTCTVEYSSNLTGSWTTAVDGVNGVTIVTTPVDSNFDHMTVTIPTSEAKLFARLRVAR
jgi:hypothetical protein